MRKPLVKRKAINLTVAVVLLTFTLAEAALGQAQIFHFHEFDAFASIVFVPCANGGAGEIVFLSGTLHTHVQVTTNGNRANFKAMVKPQVVTGLGLSTGDVYRGVGLTEFHETGSLSGEGANMFTSVNNFRLIGPGPDNNFQVHQNVHQTINANGEITSIVDNATIVCN